VAILLVEQRDLSGNHHSFTAPYIFKSRNFWSWWQNI